MKRYDKKKITALALALCMGASLAGCGTGTSGATGGSKTASTTTSDTQTIDQTEAATTSRTTREVEVVHAADAEELRTEILGDFSISSNRGALEGVDGVYTITEAGEYTISGLLTEGQIVVQAPDNAEVTLILAGASISSQTGAPICVISADKVKIQAEEGTFNEVIDAREESAGTASSGAASEGTDSSDADSDNVNEADAAEEEGEENDSDYGAAIWADCDLTLNGSGALVVNGAYNNGIQSRNDLKIKNLTLKVTAVNNALKGNHSVTIESGQILAISTGGDGIKTSDSEMKKKQQGTVSIEGGTIDIYAACDGIDAAYNAEVSGEDTVLNIYTASYSDYSGALSGDEEGAEETSDFYLILNPSDYSEDYAYYAYYYKEDMEDGIWKEASYDTQVSSRKGTYYGLLLAAPSGYSNVCFFRFEAGQEPSVENYEAVSDSGTVNDSKNGYMITSFAEGTISGDWVSLQTSSSRNMGGPGGMGGWGSGNTDKTEYSAKGIKADNEVRISGGTITIKSGDDAIHANGDVTLETGSLGSGSVVIDGGSITATAADDGIHADNEVTINGGYINIETSYEGIEGNVITINDGEIFVYAKDDGLNAASGNLTSYIYINGGYVDVTTPSGDTDAIDSNGYYEQNGGFVLVKGGASTGGMAGSIDVDREITIKGGTCIALGGICEYPQGCESLIYNRQSFAAGDYSLTDSEGNEILSFTLAEDYSCGWICSDLIDANEDYTLQ